MPNQLSSRSFFPVRISDDLALRVRDFYDTLYCNTVRPTEPREKSRQFTPESRLVTVLRKTSLDKR